MKILRLAALLAALAGPAYADPVADAVKQLTTDNAAVGADITALEKAISATVPIAPVFPPSPSGATIGSVGAYVVDGATPPNVFSIVSGNRGNDTPAQQLARNGTTDTATGAVILGLVWNSTFYQENDDKNWWAWSLPANNGWVSVPGDPRVAAPPSAAGAPPPAVSAGFTNEDFSEPFLVIAKSIDLANSGATGFSFYIQDAFDAGSTPPNVFSQISGGGVAITGPGAPNASAATWSPKGTIFAPLFGYTQYKAAFRNPNSGNVPGWGALWGEDETHLATNNLDYYVERDLVEIFNGAPTSTFHDWGNATPTGSHFQIGPLSWVLSPGFDITQPHLYGELHEDLGGGKGRISTWLDNTFEKCFTYGPTIVPFYCDAEGNDLGNVPGAAIGTLSGNYTKPVALIVGTGSNMPLDLYEVDHYSK
jgi:hypothetical protein